MASRSTPTRSSKRRTAAMRRIAYELSGTAGGGLRELSGDILTMAVDFIKQSQKAAESLAPMKEDPEEYMEYFEDFLDGTPSLHQITSNKLIDILMDNPALGAIPLKDLRAADLIRGEQIDVYDYLQAAVEAAVATKAQQLVREELGKRPAKKPREEVDQEGGTLPADEEGTVFEKPKVQEASVRIGNCIYRRLV